MSTSTSSAEWTGTLKEGRGKMRVGKGAWEGPFTFASRFESGEGTNPEELIGAAHAGCYSMFLSALLTKAGYRVVEMTPHRRVVRLSYLISRIEPYCKPLYQILDFAVRQSGQGDRLVAVDLGDIFMTFARKIG